MNLKFLNLPKELEAGAKRASKTLDFKISEDGLEIQVVKCDGIFAKKCGNEISVGYKEKIHFFRALGLLTEKLRSGEDFFVEEEAIFNTCGAMPDLSNYAALSVDGLCKFMDYMAVMGLNMFLLYIEDLYEIPSRKYFGHMRGKYTQEELRAIDDYGFDYGIEVIPCMQTLGHLEKYLYWGEAADVREAAGGRELSVDKPEAYKFIEEMLIACTAPLRSKRIHIGMDEVWGLGRGGESLKKFGVRDQEQLFLEHLNKVVKITDRLGLRPMIWNDFVYCLHSESGVNKYDKETEIPKEIMARFPKNVDLVYWHYGEEVMGCDDHMVEKNLEFGNNVIYAGGLIMWNAALPDNIFSYDAAEEGLAAAKKHGLTEVFTTLWCHGGRGCDIFTSLLHLQQFAEHTYNKNVTRDDLKRRFEACTGASFDAFMNMSQLSNIIDGREYKDYNARYHGQKFMWQDILIGKYECFLIDNPISSHYSKYEKYYADFAAKGGRWKPLYDRCRALFDLLASKTYIAENLRRAYLGGDKEFLEKCETTLLPELLIKIDTVTEEYRKMWFATRKAFGFELFDERMGRLYARCKTAIQRLRSYRLGECSAIEELAEPRLPMPESLWTGDN